MKNLAKRLAATLANMIGPREVGLLAGLALLGYGAGSVYLPAGFFLPGAVLLYVVIAGLR
jgi:hypothetical protein